MIQDISTVASKLLELSGNFKKTRLEEQAKIAKFFYRIGECLREVARELQAGNEPHDKVRELEVLAEKLPDAIGQKVNKDKANELSQLLRQAIGDNLENLNNNERIIQQIKRCAGEFEALAFTVGYSSSKSSSTKSLLVVLGVIGLVGVSIWFVLNWYFSAPDWLSDGTEIELETQLETQLGSQSGWLDAYTGSGTVGLAPSPPSVDRNYSGARWRVHEVCRGTTRLEDTISLETMGDGNDASYGRRLNGQTQPGKVVLALSAGGDYSGAEWKVEVVNRFDKTTVLLRTLGTQDGAELLAGTGDGKVELVQSETGNSRGTRWKVKVLRREPSSFLSLRKNGNCDQAT